MALACVGPASDQSATVFFASGADLQSINSLVAVHPLAKQVQKHVLFLTLAAYDSALVPVPRLARWGWSSGRTRLMLQLRDDVYWHDGVRTTSSDVAWTLEMAMRPAVAYPRRRDLDAVASVEVLDSFSLALNFNHRQPVFPDVFTDLAILPAHRFEGVAPEQIRNSEFNRRPVGNGPFEFAEYIPNQRWVFRRSESFPSDLGRAKIDRFVVVVVDESVTKLAALTSGELDFAGINPAHSTFVNDNPELRVLDYPLLFSYALVLNLRRNPFSVRQMREAISLAIDRQTIVEAYVYGYGTPAEGPVPHEHPYYTRVGDATFAPDAARAILDGLGWLPGVNGIRERDGRKLEFTILTVGTADNALEQLLQEQLRKVGIGVSIRQRELGAFLDIAQSPARDFDALVTGVPGVLSLSQIAAMFEGDGPLAYPGYEGSEFSRVVAAAAEATAEIELEEAWHAAQAVLTRDIPTVWLYHARGVQGMNRRVAGVRMDLRGELAGIASWYVGGERRH